MKICIDAGHGPDTPGKRTPPMPDGKQIQEYQFNVPTARFLQEALQRNGFQTLLTTTGEVDVPLAQRVKIANDAKADAFVSIHYNAFRGNWDETGGGVETHHYPGSVKGRKLAQLVQKYVAQGTPQVNRGVKETDLYVLRETNMPSILVECGFMDVRREAALMLNPEFQKETAEQICQGICEFFNVPYRPVKEGSKVEDIKIIVDGKELEGKLIDGKSWVKVTDIIEALTKKVRWDANDRKVIVE